jgi:hypothetical protein
LKGGWGGGGLVYGCVLIVFAFCSLAVLFAPATASSLMRATAVSSFNTVDIYRDSTATTAPLTTAPATTAAPPPSTTAPTTTVSPLTTAPFTTAAPPPFTTSPSPPPPPPCTDDCGSCCCPGCRAINGTCYACAAGSYSSDCSNHTQSSCSVCPSGFFCPGGASQPSECPSGTQAGQGAADASQCTAYSAPQLLPAIVAAIVICVLLADLFHACFFVRRNAIKIASSKAWILACVMLGPLVWPMWWYRQRALRRANANTPLLTSRWSESEPRAIGPAPLPPGASAPPLEHSQRLNHNGLADSRMIVKPSAPPADDEAYVAVAQPVLPHAGGSAAHAAAAAVAPAHQPAAGDLPLAPNLDKPSDDMTDQCPPTPSAPSTLAHSRAAAIHTLLLRVASAV